MPNRWIEFGLDKMEATLKLNSTKAKQKSRRRICTQVMEELIEGKELYGPLYGCSKHSTPKNETFKLLSARLFEVLFSSAVRFT